ncbi:MAG TPA: TlpA disulfide reductase family protein [bacterium]|nr:TlpA disulfide reductase family protein [bacterium]
MTPPVRSIWGVRAALLIPVAAVLGVLAWAMVHHERSLEIGEALARGDTPPVPAVTLLDFDGHQVSLAALRDHPMVVNFWASWCVPCREEAPLLEGIWKEYRARGVIVLGIDTQDLTSPARRFLGQFGITYRNLRDPDGTGGHLFGTTGVPETFFVGADGRIRGKFPGEQGAPAVWREAVEGLLAGRAHVP